ncbi:MAG: zinc ribbon domain-containing protein, partial [Chloroflexaceae bacterium]|nr:zinc ribbon domain-containing protein [Chloroflexaceae bacterium]
MPTPCPTCHAELPPDARFCPACGAAVAGQLPPLPPADIAPAATGPTQRLHAATPRRCPKCNHHMEGGFITDNKSTLNTAAVFVEGEFELGMWIGLPK